MTFNKNCWYVFANQSCQAQFERLSGVKQDFGDWIDMNPFKVKMLNDFGEVEVVSDQAGDDYVINISATEGARYFTEREDLSWKQGEFYICKDPKGFLWSTINTRFWNDVGYNSFRAKRVSGDENWCAGRLVEVEYIDSEGDLITLKKVFSEDERKYFEVYKFGSLTSVEYLRGSNRDLDAPFNPLKEDEDLEMEVHEPEMALGVGIETDEDDEKAGDEEDTVEPFIKVSGAITFKVDDELTRVQAIKYLQNMKW